MLNKCYIGDCTNGLRGFAEARIRVQTCVTSPPYWGLRDYGHDGQFGLEPTPSDYAARLVEIFSLIREVLTEDGTAWLNLGDSYAAKPGQRKPTDKAGPKQTTNTASVEMGSRAILGLKPKNLVGIPWLVAFALRADGWYLRQDIIWHKPNPMPESVRDRCTKSHEYLFLLSKSESYYFDADAIAEPLGSDPASWGRHSNKDPGMQAVKPRPMFGPDRDGRDGTEWGDGLSRNRRSVWTIPTRPYPDAHFATFPRTLVEPCILAGSRPGDIVLDPFMGSGTTAQVAEHLGRQWIGCEINPEYAALQANRLRQQYLELETDLPGTGT